MSKREKTVAILVMLWSYIVIIFLYGGSLGIWGMDFRDRKEIVLMAGFLPMIAVGYLQYYVPYENIYSKKALKSRFAYYTVVMLIMSILGILGKKFTEGMIQTQMHALFITVFQVAVIIGLSIWYYLVFRKSAKEECNKTFATYTSLWIVITALGFYGMYGLGW